MPVTKRGMRGKSAQKKFRWGSIIFGIFLLIVSLICIDLFVENIPQNIMQLKVERIEYPEYADEIVSEIRLAWVMGVTLLLIAGLSFGGSIYLITKRKNKK